MYILRQKQYAADYSRYYGEDENRGMSTGAKVGLGALGTLGAAAGAVAAGRRGFLGAKAMRTINSGWAKAGRALGSDAMMMSGSRGVAASEAMSKGQINRRGADLLRQGNLDKFAKSKDLTADFGIKKGDDFLSIGRQVQGDATAWRGKHNNMQTAYDKRLSGAKSRKDARLEKDLKAQSEAAADEAKEAGKTVDNKQGNKNNQGDNKNNNQGNNKNNNQGNKNNNQGNNKNNNQGNKNNNQGNKNNVQTQSEAAADAAKNVGKNKVLPTHTDTRQQDLQNMYRD